MNFDNIDTNPDTCGVEQIPDEGMIDDCSNYICGPNCMWRNYVPLTPEETQLKLAENVLRIEKGMNAFKYSV